MPAISVRGTEMPASPIRKLAPLAEAAKQRGVHVYHLNIGQPDVPTPQVALDAIRNIDRKVLEYSPSQGFRSYREKLTGYYRKYNIHLTADDIIITAGGSEAVLFAFLACLNPGDEIIVPEPAYANYMAFAISAGATIRTIATTIEEGFALPKVEKFEELINERTRAILICNPNNPTGYLYSRREMNQIRDLVKKYDLFLFSDEVYREFIYTGSPYISACHLEGIEQNVVLIDSVSKRYSECGIRIGALITKNPEIRQAVMKFCQARLSPPLIGQIAAEASLDVDDEYMRDVYDEYVERRKCLFRHPPDIGNSSLFRFDAGTPQAAFQPNHILPRSLWCVSDSDTPETPENPGGEKFSREGRPAVLRHSARTFFGRGEGCKEAPRPRARPARAPKRSVGHRRQRARKASRFCRISAIVLRLWQEWQRL